MITISSEVVMNDPISLNVTTQLAGMARHGQTL